MVAGGSNPSDWLERGKDEEFLKEFLFFSFLYTVIDVSERGWGAVERLRKARERFVSLILNRKKF